MKAPGWGVGEEVLRLLPGPAFEVEQTSDDKGLPIERPVQDRKLTGLRRSILPSATPAADSLSAVWSLR